MAEVLVQFDALVTDDAGRDYRPRACGRGRQDGLWEGWIEFVPLSGGPVLGSERETTQPNRDDLVYWATGLTATYLDGVLHRTLKPRPAPPPPPVREAPAFDRPAPHVAAPPPPATPRAVLDPFQVFAQGDDVLRDQLLAMSEAQLRNIAAAYGLLDPAYALTLTRPALAGEIVEAVRRRAVG